MLRSGLFWRLFGSFCLLLLGVIGVLAVVVFSLVERVHERQLQERLRSQVLLVREVVRAHENRPPGELEASLKQLRLERLPRVTLVKEDGSVVFDTDGDAANMDNHGERPEIIAARQQDFGTFTRSSPTLNTTFGYAAIRISPTRQGVAFVRVALETTSFAEELAGLRAVVWTTAAVTAVLALILAFWLARRIAAPIRELTEGADTIAGGLYGHKVYATGADEVQTLAKTFNHMSERLASQFAQLDEERQQLRAILSGMVEGVVALNADEHILFANERALVLLDLSGQAVIGRKLWEVVRLRGLTELVRKAMVEPEPCREELTRGGQSMRVLTAHAARLQGHVARGAVLVLHDTTELRRLERLRQEFVANVSHELKTPLAVIQAAVETLLDGAADDPSHRTQFLERVRDEGNRLHNLILDLLSLARIESGTEAFVFQPVNLDEEVANCLLRHRALADSNQQSMEVLANAGPEEVVAWADEEAVGQILDNLVDNALKYTPRGGQVSVRCYGEDGHACLEVKDTGIGIPERDLPRVFERFYRVDKARSRELGGTGLGLSIVKHLVQAMHGTVKAQSVVGKGSTFHVRLPGTSSGQ